MESNVHTLRLGRSREPFFCPYTRLYLSPGGVMQGTVPADANLENIKKALRSGRLIDVYKTINLNDKKKAVVVDWAQVIEGVQEALAPVAEIQPEIEPEIEPEIQHEVEPKIQPEVEPEVEPEVQPEVEKSKGRKSRK
jgi:hypothetical protein